MTWSESFRAYLDKHGLRAQQFALKHRFSPSKVHYWLHGATPRVKTRVRVEKITSGEVPAFPTPAESGPELHKRPSLPPTRVA